MPPREQSRASGHTKNPARRQVLLLLGELFVNGGIQRFNRTLLAACARLDVDCDVLTLNDVESCRDRRQMPSTIHIRGFNHGKLRFALATLYAALFGRYDTIVVGHVNLLTLAVASLTLRRISRPRLFMIAHGVEVWSCVRGRRRRALAAVDQILCVSSYTAQRIHQQAPELLPHHFTIFPNALGETWKGQSTPTLDSAEHPVIPRRFLLSVTRLDRNERYKGLVTALEAFAMLEDPSLHYVIAGRGDDQQFLERVALRLRVGERVHFVGGVSDSQLARLYRNCVAFVLPSGKEGFGIVFLEAMYFGAPVIAAAAKGALDVVQHEHTGLLVAYGNSVALRQAMERLLVDKQLSGRLRTAGTQTVVGEGRFTFDAYVRRLAVILEVPDLNQAPCQELLH